MERPNVPKFGNWDNKGDGVPYTVYFDKARRGRGEKKIINPNDPEQNPDLFSDDVSEHNKSRKPSIDETPPPQAHQRRGSNASTIRSTSRLSAGSDRSFERSPIHPQQYRGKGVAAFASPARDMKSPLHNNHGNRTPVRTRMKPTSKDHGTAIPPFGQWDERDPGSAEDLTHIFNTASKERQTRSSNNPPVDPEPSYYKSPKHTPNDDQPGCCFGWFRK